MRSKIPAESAARKSWLSSNRSGSYAHTRKGLCHAKAQFDFGSRIPHCIRCCGSRLTGVGRDAILHFHSHQRDHVLQRLQRNWNQLVDADLSRRLCRTGWHPVRSADSAGRSEDTLLQRRGAIAYPVIVTLTANQTATGTVEFLNFPPPCTPCPVSLPRREEHGLTQGLALAGALLFGFGFRRRAARILTLTLLAVGVLAGLAGISACGGNKSVVTPGTYTYTLTAASLDTNTVAPVTTSISVTVP